MTDFTNSDTVTGPPEVRLELEALMEEHGGRITAQLMVEAAANPASSLHEHFLWDDTEAAHRYRLQQAGALLRRFQIVRQAGGRTVTVPAYVRVPDSVNGYARTPDILGSDWVVQQRRLRLIGSMERLRAELANWDEFVGIVGALDEAIAAAR